MMYLCLLSLSLAAGPAHFSSAIPPASAASITFCVRDGRIVVCNNGGPTVIRRTNSSTGVNLFAANELAAADVPKQPLSSTGVDAASTKPETVAAPRSAGVITDPFHAERNVSVQAPGVSVRVRTAGAPVYGHGYGTVTSGSTYYGASSVSYESGARKHRVRGLLHRIFHRR